MAVMTITISRNGQQYGPYTEQQAREYLRQGTLSPTDLAYNASSGQWVPLSQLFGPPSPPPQAAWQQPPVQQPVYRQVDTPVRPPLYYPTPPDLHWLLVALLTLVTFGLFAVVWIFVQGSFVKKIDPNSNARSFLVLYLVSYVCYMFCYVVVIGMAAAGSSANSEIAALFGLGLSLFGLLLMVFFLIACFKMKSSLERHYTSVEPIALRLSGPMTFFFNILYFQYHFRRIAKWKETGLLT
jgi:hypothetical protein